MYSTLVKQRAYSRKWYIRNKEKKREISRKDNLVYRMKVLTHYSKGSPRCECCGENNLEFLSLDHIDGGGKEHRKTTGNGTQFYRWVVKNNFPPILRVLCMNCNTSYGHYGYCPHKRGKNAVSPH